MAINVSGCGSGTALSTLCVQRVSLSPGGCSR